MFNLLAGPWHGNLHSMRTSTQALRIPLPPSCPLSRSHLASAVVAPFSTFCRASPFSVNSSRHLKGVVSFSYRSPPRPPGLCLPFAVKDETRGLGVNKKEQGQWFSAEGRSSSQLPRLFVRPCSLSSSEARVSRPFGSKSIILFFCHFKNPKSSACRHTIPTSCGTVSPVSSRVCGLHYVLEGLFTSSVRRSILIKFSQPTQGS